mgnify:CR=1 FL=1
MELLQYWRLLRQNRLLIAATTLAGLILSIVITFTTTPIYQANAELFVSTPASTLDISALSFHKLLSTAMRQDAISEWGSVVALSFIAAHRVFPDYTDMAEAKAVRMAVV